eukprot:7631345-Pyramimonas_sp.AAC.1
MGLCSESSSTSMTRSVNLCNSCTDGGFSFFQHGGIAGHLVELNVRTVSQQVQGNCVSRRGSCPSRRLAGCHVLRGASVVRRKDCSAPDEGSWGGRAFYSIVVILEFTLLAALLDVEGRPPLRQE